MDCSICYETVPTGLKLFCGHSYCKECLFKWCTQGSNENCPTCRKPINFRGYSALKERWHDEKMESQFSEQFGNIIDRIFEYVTRIKALQDEDPDDLEIDDLITCMHMNAMEKRGLCYIKYIIVPQELAFNKLKYWVYPDEIFEALDDDIYTVNEHTVRDPIQEIIPYYRPLHSSVISVC
jgi:hypothetical protein